MRASGVGAPPAQTAALPATRTRLNATAARRRTNITASRMLHRRRRGVKQMVNGTRVNPDTELRVSPNTGPGSHEPHQKGITPRPVNMSRVPRLWPMKCLKWRTGPQRNVGSVRGDVENQVRDDPHGDRPPERGPAETSFDGPPGDERCRQHRGDGMRVGDIREVNVGNASHGRVRAHRAGRRAGRSGP
jgi:hypothetical protein